MNSLLLNITLYIGPGLGAGTIAVIIGILSSFIISIIAILWFPIKKIIRMIRSKKNK